MYSLQHIKTISVASPSQHLSTTESPKAPPVGEWYRKGRWHRPPAAMWTAPCPPAASSEGKNRWSPHFRQKHHADTIHPSNIISPTNSSIHLSIHLTESAQGNVMQLDMAQTSLKGTAWKTYRALGLSRLLQLSCDHISTFTTHPNFWGSI